MVTKANIVVDQGATFSIDITLQDDNGDPINLTGFTGRSQLRKHYTSSNSQAFTVSLNVALGLVTLSLTANQTSNIVAGRYVYDVEVASSEQVLRIIEGIVTVTPEVTR